VRVAAAAEASGRGRVAGATVSLAAMLPAAMLPAAVHTDDTLSHHDGTVSLADRIDAREVDIGVDGTDDGAQSHQHEQHDDGYRQHLMTSELPAFGPADHAHFPTYGSHRPAVVKMSASH